MRASVTPPEISVLARPRQRLHGLDDVGSRQVVEQDDVGAGPQRLVHLLERLRLDLGRHLAVRLAHPRHRLLDAARQPDVVVLDQDARRPGRCDD